ncbi:TrbC/VirB2 family protein [Stenoxybacter acetivorans]|uniref:TrbC/VirB2 family protein n=1 Tax=Stenoxybacter acetivorans TaxID=422441 RepID=UPI00068CECB5|nr:TrbC/VirB2 family protein [Stenoxybacter acetivorans]
MNASNNPVTAYQQTARWGLMLAACLLSSAAMAAGLETEAKGMLTNISSALKIIIGVVAGISLMWQFAQGFMGRKEWADIFQTCAWIVGAACALALAEWLFKSGGAISF